MRPTRVEKKKAVSQQFYFWLLLFTWIPADCHVKEAERPPGSIDQKVLLLG